MDRGSDSDEARPQVMVCLSAVGDLTSLKIFDPFAGLWSAVIRTLEAGDLDAHVTLLILRASRVCVEPTLGVLSAKLIGAPSSDTSLSRSKDVAILGAQLALDRAMSNGDRFERAVRRELARRPLPPAACIHDDERLLIGVAAGIGSARPVLSSELINILRSRPQPCTIRQQCVDLWAESLSCGEKRFSTAIAERSVEILRQHIGKASKMTPEDCVVLCWLAGRVLESEWVAVGRELDMILEFLDAQKNGVGGLVALLGTVTGVDAAFLLTLQNVPSLKSTKTSVALILEIIDGFTASASVLSKRHRDRTPFVISDEYDLQDLFRALVVPLVPDLTPEDPAPKLAGKSSRLDFTSRSSRLGVELKHVKSKHHADEVREEILVDQGTYFRHPDVDSVITFVFDPERFIAEDQRSTFEADLSRSVSIQDRAINHIVRVR